MNNLVVQIKGFLFLFVGMQEDDQSFVKIEVEMPARWETNVELRESRGKTTLVIRSRRRKPRESEEAKEQRGVRIRPMKPAASRWYSRGRRSLPLEYHLEEGTAFLVLGLKTSQPVT